MKYVEAPEEFEGGDTTVFLAGGISNCPDWQQDFVEMLNDTDLVLFNPRRANFPMGDKSEGHKQILWEARYLDKSDIIIFWFPMETICPIVLFELGSWSMTQKPIFVGCHPEYSRRFDVEAQLSIRRPSVQVVYGLDYLAKQLINYHNSEVNQNPNQTAKNEGVLFHCYKCEVDMIRIEDRDGEPAFQCPKCLDVAQFDLTQFDSIIHSSEQKVSQKC